MSYSQKRKKELALNNGVCPISQKSIKNTNEFVTYGKSTYHRQALFRYIMHQIQNGEPLVFPDTRLPIGDDIIRMFGIDRAMREVLARGEDEREQAREREQAAAAADPHERGDLSDNEERISPYIPPPYTFDDRTPYIPSLSPYIPPPYIPSPYISDNEERPYSDSPYNMFGEHGYYSDGGSRVRKRTIRRKRR